MTEPTTQEERLNWANESDDGLPPSTSHTEEDGTHVTISYRRDEASQRIVRVERRLKRRPVEERVNKAVAERQKWTKFGAAQGLPRGPDVATTTVGEQVFLKLTSQSKTLDQEDVSQSDQLAKQLKDKKIICRLCKGEHWTTKCPYKDNAAMLATLAAATGDSVPVADVIPKDTSTVISSAASVTASATATTSGRYVPPAQRKREGGAAPSERGTGDGMPVRDDSCTLRVTNLPEDTQEAELHHLFGRHGPIDRLFMARDKETGDCRGFAFVTFVKRDDAAKALQAMQGFPYRHLILRCEWAK